MKKKDTFAIIVTVKSDPQALERLLADVADQTQRPDEVVIASAGRDQETENVLASWESHMPLSVYYLPNEATRSEGRNFAVKKAESSVLVFTDVGCRLDKNWFKEITKPFQFDTVKLVSGFTEPTKSSAWEEAQGLFVLVRRNNIEEHPLPATRNMAIQKNVFLQNKGFHNHLNFAEDYDFSLRLRKNGIHALFAPKAMVFWQPRRSLPSFFMMIAKLTAGDIQAKNIRRGLYSMWFRYAAFLILLLFFPQVFIGIYVLYLLLKVGRVRTYSRAVQFWILLLQPVCDVAVITGTILGLVWRVTKRENT